MSKLLIATIDTYTKAGRFVPKGSTVDSAEVDFDENSTNLIKAPAGVDGLAVVQISAIAPTGPNPQNPQQIAPGTVQTEAGYVQDGARLVGEVTVPEKQRFEVISDADDETQALVTQAIADNAADTSKADAKAAKAKA